jgi:hypothetical protein
MTAPPTGTVTPITGSSGEIGPTHPALRAECRV